MDTEKIVMDLYSLRAGLSLLSKETDKYEDELIAAEYRKTEELNQVQEVEEKYDLDDQCRVYWNKWKETEQATEKAKYERDRAFFSAKYDIRARKKEKPLLIRTLILGILFLILHFALAGLAYYNIFLLDFNGFIFLPIFAVSLGIGITELVWTPKRYYFRDYVLRGLIRKDLLAKSFSFIFYPLNVVSYFAFMIIGFIGASANVDTTAIVTVIAVSTIMCALLTTGMIFRNYDHYHVKPKLIQSKENNFARLDEEYRRLKAEEETCRETYENYYKTTLNRRKDEYETKCGNINAQYKATCTASAKAYTTICTSIWDTLVQTYGSLIAARDWKILDLVIWQLETHRAETLKEALQLADREVQTDRIVGTLKSACEAIGSQIRMGFGSLQSQLDYNFNTLASGFATAAYQISGKIDALSDSVAGSVYDLSSRLDSSMQIMQENQTAMNRSFEQICSQSSLQTALLEKANISSSNLLEAVNKLRNTKFKLETN